MTASTTATPALFARTDTSICTHLSTLLASPAAPVPGNEPRQDGSVANGTAPGSAPATKKAEVEKRFVEIVRWGSANEGVKRWKTSPPECQTCSTPLTRPWACLSCTFIGCLPFAGTSSSSASKDCMRSHWRDSDGKCGFAADPSSGAIYCHGCSDTIYPDSFESILRVVRIRMEEAHDKSREPSLVGGGRGRGRGAWKAWNPSNMVKVEEGETCFLSAILQSLIHNPLLKAYFLSDKHNRHVCPNGSKGLGLGKPFLANDGGNGPPGPEREKGCMCCEMDRAFEEFYNEDKSPYGPITMLYAMWHASAELEGHGQQDAHSFFLAALDQIHAHAKGQLSSCNCIAHQTFAGSLMSSVTCSSCSTTSSTIDPILDIQLDFPLPPSTNSTSNMSSTASTSSSEGVGPGQNGSVGPLTLAGLLRRFCAPERVGGPESGGRGYECSSCGGGPATVAIRKFSVKKLAPVLSFQLKRFAHHSATTSTKIETHVKFPSTLNMRAYVDSHAVGPGAADQADGGGSTEGHGSEASGEPLPDSLFLYDLFAVVTHEGKLDNGHYWADVREGEEWWHCDDDKVTPTTLASVLAQKAYMLFYVKRSLAYAQPMSKLLSSASTTSVPVISNEAS